MEKLNFLERFIKNLVILIGLLILSILCGSIYMLFLSQITKERIEDFFNMYSSYFFLIRIGLGLLMLALFISLLKDVDYEKDKIE